MLTVGTSMLSHIHPNQEPTKDDTDPFLIDQPSIHLNVNVSELPKHPLIIYVMVCWFHMQFKLPQIACHAVLMILACLLTFFNPQLTPLFVTLSSITRSLAVNPSINWSSLPKLPRCISVGGLTKHARHLYIMQIISFLPTHMNQGNPCSLKTPIIKSLYLSLS